MKKTLIVIVAMLAALALMSPAGARAVDSDANHASHWGEDCTKIHDEGLSTSSWTADRGYRLVVLKSALVNDTFHDVDAGDVLTTASGKDISHIIVCGPERTVDTTTTIAVIDTTTTAAPTTTVDPCAEVATDDSNLRVAEPDPCETDATTTTTLPATTTTVAEVSSTTTEAPVTTTTVLEPETDDQEPVVVEESEPAVAQEVEVSEIKFTG